MWLWDWSLLKWTSAGEAGVFQICLRCLMHELETHIALAGEVQICVKYRVRSVLYACYWSKCSNVSESGRQAKKVYQGEQPTAVYGVLRVEACSSYMAACLVQTQSQGANCDLYYRLCTPGNSGDGVCETVEAPTFVFSQLLYMYSGMRWPPFRVWVSDVLKMSSLYATRSLLGHWSSTSYWARVIVSFGTALLNGWDLTQVKIAVACCYQNS